MINIATIVVTTSPISTGLTFFLASSKASTPQIAATGITAQGIIVPPPTHIPAIWPSAVSVATPPPKATEKILETEPTKDIPEKPEPSSPVMAPTTVIVLAETTEFMGTIFESAIPRSLTIPWDPWGSTFPKISLKAESPK